MQAGEEVMRGHDRATHEAQEACARERGAKEATTAGYLRQHADRNGTDNHQIEGKTATATTTTTTIMTTTTARGTFHQMRRLKT